MSTMLILAPLLVLTPSPDPALLTEPSPALAAEYRGMAVERLLPGVYSTPSASGPVFESNPLLMTVGAPTALYAPERPSALAKALAPAEEDEYHFSYTYVEAGYYSTSGDCTGGSSDAWGLDASIGLLGFLRVFGGYSSDSATVNGGGGSVDTDSYYLGVGGYWGLAPRLDLVGDIQWIYDDLSTDTVSNLDTSNNGWSALVGARWLVLPVGHGGLELDGGANYVDRVNGGQWGGILGARYHFLKALSAGLEYQFLQDEDRWGINVRFSF